MCSPPRPSFVVYAHLVWRVVTTAGGDEKMDSMKKQDRDRTPQPWLWVGAGLLAAGVGIVMWQRWPDYRARRLIATSERLIEKMSATLDELRQRSEATADRP
jgi:hypothetical protein